MLNSDANGRRAMTVERSGDLPADPRRVSPHALAALAKVHKNFPRRITSAFGNVRLGLLQALVDGGEQIRSDGSLEDKSIGSRFNHRQLRILFLVDAENDQLQLREMTADFGQTSPNPSPRWSERSTTARATWSSRALSNSETSSPTTTTASNSVSSRPRTPSTKRRRPSARSTQPLSFAGISSFRVRSPWRPTLAELGPGTSRHDLEDLLASGPKNYEGRQSRSCSQRVD